MKVFIIIRINPFIESSASSNRWLTLIEGLANLGIELHLLIYGGYRSAIEKEEWRKSGSKQEIKYNYITQGINKGYWKTRFDIYIGSYFSQRKIRNELFKILIAQKGIVWTDSSLFGFQVAACLKKKQMKDLKSFLELSEFLDIHKYNKGNFLQRWKADKRQKFFEENALYTYDGLALMTKTLFKHYKNFTTPSPQLLHLPMTVDLERFNKDLSPMEGFQKPYVAFVGVMNDAKEGVNLLIEAFSTLHLEFPDYHLYLVGPRNYDTPSHLKMIKNLGLERKIEWKGAYDRDQIPAIIQNAELLVLPRPDSKQAQGGFPTKLGEYLATGNPVCATKVGEIPDYLIDGESVFFAEPGSVTSFAKAMRRALSDRGEARKIGQNGLKMAQEYFNKDIQADQLLEFIKVLEN